MVSLVSLYSWILDFAVFISVYTYIVVCARANQFVRGCVTRNYISIADALTRRVDDGKQTMTTTLSEATKDLVQRLVLMKSLFFQPKVSQDG